MVLLGNALRVVVAEDDSEMRQLIVGALERDGHEVVHVSNGAALVAHLGPASAVLPSADLVISDLRMPRVSGLAVLRALRGGGCLVPFVLMTAFSEPELAVEVSALGGVLVDKPFDLDDLRTVAMLLLRARVGTLTARPRPPS